MSALPREAGAPALLPMEASMLDAVTAIEHAAYDFPWTRGNFLDSMSAGYTLRVLQVDGQIVGYYVAMPGVDELHLLNLTVAPAAQRHGCALLMLEALRAQALLQRARELWLEVRASNQRAREIYERFGFRHCGVRRKYYPAAAGGREDAVVMSLALSEQTRMGWDERQQRLLEAMGVRLWPQAVAAEPPLVDEAAPITTAPPREKPAPVAPPTVSPVAVCSGDAAALDWPALQAAVAACRACPSLCDSRTQTVFGVGHPSAHWMIVGEAPGENEDRQGEPFVGKAGQLLDNMLAALGLARSGDDEPARRVYIANALKCRPPGNRNPAPEEIARCAPFLKRQIELVQPRLILALGRFAVASLLGSDEPIGRLRGRAHRAHGVPVVVSYHPAYLLRSPLEKARAWEDLCLARELMKQR